VTENRTRAGFVGIECRMAHAAIEGGLLDADDLVCQVREVGLADGDSNRRLAFRHGDLHGLRRRYAEADPQAFDSKLEVGFGKTAHTHALNEDISAMVNLPLSETAAVRLNGSWSDDAGFINQPDLYALNPARVPIPAQPNNLSSPPVTHSEQGTNSYQYRNARIAALLEPNDDFKAELSYYYQTSAANGFPYVAPAYGITALSSADHTRARSAPGTSHQRVPPPGRAQWP